ncbi:Alpha/Beta hydrolase protein [Hyaloscypha sp. PMI_1271]|nr:Alpha/Beta hydrolase protein [Hyaloscypha sp. PMI_1271]
MGVFVLWGFRAASILQEKPFEKLAKRDLLTPENSLQVDPGYEVYAGVANSTTQINSIRFAAPLIVSLRWQAPQPPISNSAGDGQQDLTAINANNNSFVRFSVRYRQWVQTYTSLFGRDPIDATITGENAGVGSVMLHTLAYGGSRGLSLFRNSIAVSSYLSFQCGYKDWIPTQSYYTVATQAGCPANAVYTGRNSSSLQCLSQKDTKVLEAASFNVAASGIKGTWGFLPVTDGVLLQQLPNQQLLQKQVNGVNLLSRGINTEKALVNWLEDTFPMFANNNIEKILLYYPRSDLTDNPNAPKFATRGYQGATAQRADNIHAEMAFVCPSYWLAEAFSDKGRSSYGYQYCVPIATHGTDISGYCGPADVTQSSDFEYVFIRNFIAEDNPFITPEIANGGSSSHSQQTNPAPSWPPFDIYTPYQPNLNEAGGVPFSVQNAAGNVTEGRGSRCDFWRTMGAYIPA